MNKSLFVILFLVGSTQGSEYPGITSVKWDPDRKLASSSPSDLRRLGPNSFVRALCSKKTQEESCDSCKQVYDYFFAPFKKTEMMTDACLHAIYKLGLKANRSDEQIRAEQENVLNSSPVLTIFEHSTDGREETL